MIITCTVYHSASLYEIPGCYFLHKADMNVRHALDSISHIVYVLVIIIHDIHACGITMHAFLFGCRFFFSSSKNVYTTYIVI